MKLWKINEEITNYQGSFVIHPSILKNYSEIDFADKYWELDFLSDLDSGETITPEDLSYTEKNRAKNLVNAGLVFFEEGKYQITPTGREWKAEWRDANGRRLSVCDPGP